MATQSGGITQKLAEFIVTTSADQIPTEAYEHAKVAFMDWLAVTTAGKNEPVAAKLLKYAQTQGGNAQATILGQGLKMNVGQAALINGTTSHALDYDDTLMSVIAHPSVTTFPALLALAEWQDKSGLDFLTAYLIGFQVGATIGACTGMDHYMAGWHATSTLGHLASAAGCAKLLGLNTKQTAYALGIAGTKSSGLKRVFGTMCKPYHAGNSSQAGLTAALLAQDDFTSAEDILEGADGLFHVFNCAANEDAMARLGTDWDVINVAQKYHASCHATHSPLEAAMSIVNEQHIPLAEIKKITVYVSQLALTAAGKQSPVTGLDGKFSISYCVANALNGGTTGEKAFTDEKVNDPEVGSIMNKISVVLYPKKTSLESRVVFETMSGQEHESYSDVIQQIPAFEIKKARVGKKYEDLCGAVWDESKTQYMSKMINNLDKASSMKAFVAEY